MTPNRDTEPTPVREDEPGLPLPAAPRAKRSTLGAKAKKWAGYALDKLVPAVIGLALAWVMVWQARLSSTVSDTKDVASDAKAAAETATAQGVTGQGVAVQAATATAAVVSTSKEKADSTAADLQKLTDRVNSLEAELARARSRTRRKPIKLSPKTEKPAPASIAAAVEQAASAPTGDPP